MYNSKIIKILLGFLISILIFVSMITAKYYLQEFVSIKNRKEIIFTVDDSFSKEEFSKIKRAGRDWVNKINTLKISFKLKKVNWIEMLYFGADGNATIYKAYQFGIKREAGIASSGSINVIGLAIITSGDIFILKNIDIYQITKHEIGHILMGTNWHSQDPDSIMYPYLEKNIEIKQEEINLIREKNNEYFP